MIRSRWKPVAVVVLMCGLWGGVTPQALAATDSTVHVTAYTDPVVGYKNWANFVLEVRNDGPAELDRFELSGSLKGAIDKAVPSSAWVCSHMDTNYFTCNSPKIPVHGTARFTVSVLQKGDRPETLTMETSTTCRATRSVRSTSTPIT